jgi:hypothetical protein
MTLLRTLVILGLAVAQGAIGAELAVPSNAAPGPQTVAVECGAERDCPVCERSADRFEQDSQTCLEKERKAFAVYLFWRLLGRGCAGC